MLDDILHPVRKGSASLWQLLDHPLFHIAGKPIAVTTLIAVTVIIILTLVLSSLLRRLLNRQFSKRGVDNEGSVGTVTSLVHYVILLIGFGSAAQTMGIKLSTLFAAGAVFAVGLGFAMQNIVQNFVSGIILLFERSIKPGDIVEIDNQVVRVAEMRIRSTIVRSRGGETLVVPNSTLVQSTVKNLTHLNPFLRIAIRVGVSYATDMEKVLQDLTEMVSDIEERVISKPAHAVIKDFGDSAVLLEISYWTDRPWDVWVTESRLRKMVWDLFKQSGVTIPFPQLDVHRIEAAAKGT